MTNINPCQAAYAPSAFRAANRPLSPSARGQACCREKVILDYPVISSLSTQHTWKCIFHGHSSTVVKQIYTPFGRVTWQIFTESTGITCQQSLVTTHLLGLVQSLLATQIISIYISYELIHACLRPPWTPIPHSVLFSLLKIASVLRASVSIYSGSARIRNVICATVRKRVECSDPCRTLL